MTIDLMEALEADYKRRIPSTKDSIEELWAKAGEARYLEHLWSIHRSQHADQYESPDEEEYLTLGLD